MNLEERFAALYGERALRALGAQLRNVELDSPAGHQTVPAALVVRDGVQLAICCSGDRWLIAAAIGPQAPLESLVSLGTEVRLFGRPLDDRWDDLLASLDEAVVLARTEA